MISHLFGKLAKGFAQWLDKESPPKEIPPCDFNRLKYELRPGDVLLVEGRSRISTIIRTITQSPWTHAALYIGRLHDIEDPALRQLASEYVKKSENTRLVVEGVFGQGSIISRLSTYRYHHIRICRPIGLTPFDAEQVVSYALKSVGSAYNVRQIFDLARFLLPWSILPRRWGSSLFRTPTGEPESGICSSLIAEAFMSVKFPILPFIKREDSANQELTLVQRNPYLFSPKDFDYSPYFEIIKYPLFDPKEPLPYYRRMPWDTKGALHQDDGIITEPNQHKSKRFLSSLLTGDLPDEIENVPLETPPIDLGDDRPETD